MSKLLPLLILILFALATGQPTDPPVSRPPSDVPIGTPVPGQPSAVLSPGQLLTAFPTPNGSALIVSYRVDAGNATLDLTYLSPDGTQTTDVIAIPPNPDRVIVLPCGHHVTIATNDNAGPANPINLYQLTPPPGFSFPCPASPQTYFPIISAP